MAVVLVALLAGDADPASGRGGPPVGGGGVAAEQVGGEAGVGDDKPLGVSGGATGPTSIVEDPADHPVYATNLGGALYRLLPAP